MNFIASKTGTVLLENAGEVFGTSSRASLRSRPGLLEIRARSFDQPAAQGAPAANLLSRDEQERLQSIATIVDCRRGGSHLYTEGEPARFVYFIDEGIVRTSRCAENGHRQILSFRAPGDLFGLPDGGRYVNSAETVCPARLYRLPWQRLQQMLFAEPQLQLILLEKLSHDFRQAQARIMSLGQQNTYQRLASFILEFIQRAQFYDEKLSRLKLQVNRFDLADYIGTAPESAARAFARLEGDGLVRRITSRTLEIRDIEGLKALQRGRRRGQGAVRDKAPADAP